MYRYIFAFLLYAGTLSANVLSGEIRGKITDSDNNPIQFVSVTVNEPGISVFTDSDGHYTIKDISYGHYAIIFSKTGYESQSHYLDVDNGVVILDIKLKSSLIETATIDVTSSFEAQDMSQSSFSISTLSLKNLIQTRSHNLSMTISEIPGVNVITTGIGIGKPVIRGLSSNSVIIVHDGVKHESQQWGDEHSPEISLYDLDRIEILRGPASFLYGSEGIGGVVNIISKPLQFSGSKDITHYGSIDLGGFSVNDEVTGSASYGLGFRNVGFKGHLGYRKSTNVRTPEGAFLVNTLNPFIKDTIIGGKLSNSGTKEIEGGLSFGYRSDFGYIDAGFEIFDREVQIHDIDPGATPNQKLNTNQFELSGNFNLSEKLHIEPIFSYQLHSRKEFETSEDKEIDNPGLYWKLNTFQGDLRLHYDQTHNYSGTFGISAVDMVNKSLGAEKLIPNFHTSGFGIYALEKFNNEKFTLTGGLRFDIKNINIQNTIIETDSNGAITKEISPRTINFNALSGSLGFVYRPSDIIDIFTNIGRGWRAPSEFELYVDGVHEGTNRVERGIITLDPNAEPVPESSFNIDLGARLRYKNLNVEISLFNNIVNNFIYPSPTNEIDPESGLLIYDIKQDRSEFRGVEYSIQYQPFDYLLLSLNGDYLYTNNNSTNTAVPFTPPMKNIFEIKFQKSVIGFMYNPYIKSGVKIVNGQKNVYPYETTTEGYTLIYAGIGMDFIISKSIASLDLSVENLADTKYVDHLSRYKMTAMNPGRSINLKITLPFQY
ncbi:MAG: TonB-dependent receptor [Candidatus Kapaibacterium sp.]